MYATMKNGSVSSADKYRIVDIRSDTVSKPTPEMMTAMMQVIRVNWEQSDME